jgi:hypothetical protein
MSRRRWIAVAGAVLLVLAGVTWAIAASGGDGSPEPGSTTTTTSASTTSTGPTTTSTTSTPLPPGVTPLDTTGVVWPTAASGTRFTDPVAAARSFAVDYLGFTGPTLSPFQSGSTGTGTVDVRPRAGSPSVTTVQLRQLAPDGHWWVAGSSTSAIEVTRPTALDPVLSPVRVEGRSSAFEGNVTVKVRADDVAQPLTTSFVTGGSSSELGPFSGQITFDDPGRAANGAIVFSSSSAEDGSLIGATVVRVRFGQPSADGQPAGTCAAPPARAPLDAGQTEVRVYFACDVGGQALRPVFRIVPQTTAVLRATLDQLVFGPTAGERTAGFSSPFSPDTTGTVASADLDADGRAKVGFADFRKLLPDVAVGDGPSTLLIPLDTTVLQFPTVKSVVYGFGTDCGLFSDWLHLPSCEVRARP